MDKTIDLSTCSLDELLTIRQNAIAIDSIELYRACDKAISVLYSKCENKGA
jgi:hypothetical protein